MKDITDFVPWLVGASGPELALIKAVTGYDDIPLDGLPFPADGHDFSRVVDLVEKHNLYPLLCLVACGDPMWWKIVANFDRLVGMLDAAEPRWREGEPVVPAAVDAEITRLYGRPEQPRRVLLDLDALVVEDRPDDSVAPLTDAGHEIVVCTNDPSWLDWLAEHHPALTGLAVVTPNAAWIRADIHVSPSIVHAQVPDATWEPVVLGTEANGPGSEWGRYPRWSWGDPIERLSW